MSPRLRPGASCLHSSHEWGQRSRSLGVDRGFDQDLLVRVAGDDERGQEHFGCRAVRKDALESFPSQVVERHNVPEIEAGCVVSPQLA
jgi:hypothetical protein